MKRKAVCFVDDDADEVSRFRTFMRDHYIVGAGTTLARAIDELQDQRVKKPDIFLLDLYYGPETTEAMRARIDALDEELSDSERKMRELLVEAGQSPQGGFDLSEEIRSRFPRVPRAFFSRKAFLEDALRAQDEGLPVLEKPDSHAADTGATKKERYDAAFERHAVEIARWLDRKINLNTWWVRHREKLGSFAMGFFFFLLKVGWDIWKGNAQFYEMGIWFVLLCIASYVLFFRG